MESWPVERERGRTVLSPELYGFHDLELSLPGVAELTKKRFGYGIALD
jgi:hypothetical protein